MAAKVESARERTFAERTARFWSMNRKGGPSGPSPRLMRGVTVGIADFTSCRAITRSVDIRGGGVVRRLAGTENHDAPPIYMLFDGSSMSACLLGHWRDPHPGVASNPLRGPGGLRFLDLIQPESIVDALEEGEEQVRSQPATRYRLKLDMDRIQWPDPDPVSRSSQGNSLIYWLLTKARPDPRPTGVLSAHLWIDGAGRLVRYSHSDAPVDHPKHDQAPWITTELWDFGIPPLLQNWKTQPVIDPVTLQFPETEAELMRNTQSTPEAPE